MEQDAAASVVAMMSQNLLYWSDVQVAEADEDHEPQPDGEAGGDERDAERGHPRRSFWWVTNSRKKF